MRLSIKVKTYLFGQTTVGLPIIAHEFGTTGPEVLIMGGVHGDEIEGVYCTQGLFNAFLERYSFRLRMTLVPIFNPEGVFQNQRQNSAGIDLNRNMPTKDWTIEAASARYFPGPSAGSEPESKALLKYFESHNPKCIISLHSWKPMLNVNGNCRKIAEEIQKTTNYIIEDYIGYPTPGSLGTYAGIENNMPTLTYEIERGSTASQVLSLHVPAILKALPVLEE